MDRGYNIEFSMLNGGMCLLTVHSSEMFMVQTHDTNIMENMASTRLTPGLSFVIASKEKEKQMTFSS